MKAKLLICGEQIIQDQKLFNLLREKVDVSFLPNANGLESAMQQRRIDLVLFELSKNWQEDLRQVQSVRERFSGIPFIIVDGGDAIKAVVESFRAGLEDYFKKPYNPVLLAERVEALLKRKDRMNGAK